MLDFILKTPVSGGIGFILGLAGIWWLAPTTAEGSALVIIVCVIFSLCFFTLVRVLKGRANKADQRG